MPPQPTPPSDAPARAGPGHIIESMWFWLILFSGMGLLGLLVVDNKYGKRQAQLERQFQARTQRHLSANRSQSNQNPRDQTDQNYSSEKNTLIGLGPLRAALVLVLFASAAALALERRSRTAAAWPRSAKHP